MKHSLVLALLTVGAIAAPAALAAPDSLRISDPFVLNGVALVPGEYLVHVSPTLDSVELVRDRKIVVTAACKANPLADAVTRDEVHSRKNADGDEEIVRLVLAHARLALDFAGTASTASAAAAGTGTVETR